ncbi:MAG: hypothetical protein WCH40_03395 [Verrucomicrobiales bacterium]
MSVVLIHYHLSAGGVARVIESTSRILSRAMVPHLILSGTAAENPSDLPLSVIEGLSYRRDANGMTADALVTAMRSAVESTLGPGPHIWHFHNHSLGVNLLMADAVAILARAGERLVLQLHDLAEDGRPGNYPLLRDCAGLYPVAPQIRYAFLNSRDRDCFSAAGLSEPCSMLLPNPILLPEVPPSPPPADSPAHVLYAVRAIRRKNLGEVFLLAALSPKGSRYAVTLAPSQQRWQARYAKWEAFAQQSGLPVDLGVVGRCGPEDSTDQSFEAWQARSTHLLTTSVAEGFGLGFLEAAACGKPLFGRNLPAVSKDHAAHGIKAGRLYERLLIPSTWINPEHLRQVLTATLQFLLETYGRDLAYGSVDEVFDDLHFDDYLDFANLPEDLQQSVLEQLVDGAPPNEVLVEIEGECLPATAWLREILAERTPTTTLEQLVHYLPEAHLTRLTALYDDLLAVTPHAPWFLPKHHVLRHNLRPGTFHFLLT